MNFGTAVRGRFQPDNMGTHVNQPIVFVMCIVPDCYYYCHILILQMIQINENQEIFPVRLKF
jgi:hypothetical protein